MAIFVSGLKSAMSRCKCGSSLIGPPLQQLVIQLVEEVVWHVVDELDGDDRGGGFGHTGR